MTTLSMKLNWVPDDQKSKFKALEKKLLHYTSKAINDYKMIETGDRVMVCLSGGKDSWTILKLLRAHQIRSGGKFELFSFTLDQQQPGWDDRALKAYLAEHEIPHEVFSENTYGIVKEKIPEGKTTCSLCSRLRRGIIYNYADKHGYNKIVLGHHRDDLIESLLMSIFYQGEISSMPPKLFSDCGRCTVVRPLVYCQEDDIAEYAAACQFPIIPCNLCGSQTGLKRQKMKQLVHTLAEEHPTIRSNILHAMQAVRPSQLMDKSLWDFDPAQHERKAKAKAKDNAAN